MGRIIMKSVLLVSGVVCLGLAACSRNDDVVVAQATAAEGTECVNRAAEAYGVELQYINLGPIGSDPSNAYPFAIPGTVERAAGQSTTFLCRLGADRQLIDVVTFQRQS